MSTHTGTQKQITEPQPSVAVIVVHGVSDPPPGEYSALVADQLREIGACTDFRKEQIRLRVLPVGQFGQRGCAGKLQATTGGKQAGEESDPEVKYGGFSAEQTPAAIRKAMVLPGKNSKIESKGARKPTSGSEAETEQDLQRRAAQFSLDTMEEQLRDLELPPGERFHETTVHRAAATGGGQVDVHELYWGDLSRPGLSAFRWFVELYQLLFQVVALGRFALDYARGMHPHSRRLSIFSKVHHAGLMVLTIFVPVGNIMLAILTAGVFSALLLPCGWPAWLSLILVAALMGFAWKKAISGFERDLPGIEPWYKVGGIGLTVLFCLTGSIVPTWFGRLLLKMNNDSVHAFSGMTTGHWSTDALMHASLSWLGVLYLLWLALPVIIIAASVLQMMGPKVCAVEEENIRVRRSLWTVIISLVPTTAIALLLNLGLWAAALSAAGALPETIKAGDNFSQMHEKAGDLLTRTGDLVLPVIVLVVILIGWAGAALFPGILADVKWRRTLPQRKNKTESLKLGRKMTRGLLSIRYATEFFRAVLILSWVAGAAWILLRGNSGLLGTVNGWMLGILSFLFLAIVIPKGPLQHVASTFRTVLDAALDVINWLRPYPAKATPRGRICARYASLLRHLCDPVASGRNYSRIVIVAHSQGNMLTSDLLRYLNSHASNRDFEPELRGILDGAIEVAYLSLASPMGQVYSVRFPHQYAWGRSVFADETARRPDASQLGVTAWVNAFHSGDYIGRHLWTNPNEDASYEPAITHTCSGIKEMCLGQGGHLHYFDPESTTVAECIRDLIARKPTGAPAGPA